MMNGALSDLITNTLLVVGPGGNLAEDALSDCLEFSLRQAQLAVEKRGDRTGTDRIPRI
jgi:hypothetical protein